MTKSTMIGARVMLLSLSSFLIAFHVSSFVGQAEFELAAGVVALPLSGTYLDATEPLPLSSPCNSRDPISISACPVEIA
jgi:hypothetical protein